MIRYAALLLTGLCMAPMILTGFFAQTMYLAFALGQGISSRFYTGRR